MNSPSAAEDFDEEVTDASEPISDPFDPTRINVVREAMTIFQVMRKVENGEIKLDPDFQRNVVWDGRRQSRLIESILLKIPLPALYLDAVEPNQWAVVDGLQRLYTLNEFFNKKKLRLSNLEFLGKKFEGMTFSELPRSGQRDIEETYLTLYVIRPETPPKVKFTIFYRINTGGMVLTGQEIRHATFPGRAPGLLRQLASSKEFLGATVFSVNPKRMDDRECVLRHLAFRMTPFEHYSRPDLNDFLGNAMEALNQVPESEVARLTEDFHRSMKLSAQLFGQYGFRKFDRRTSKRGPVNKALFETWSTAVLEYESSALLAHAEQIIAALERALTDDPEYLSSLSLSTGNIRAVRKRFSKAHQIISEALAL